MSSLPTPEMLQPEWVYSIIVNRAEDLTEPRFRLFLSLVAKFVDFLGWIFKIQTQIVTEDIINYDDYTDEELEENDHLWERMSNPHGLDLSEEDYQKLCHHMFNLYDWSYDKITESPCPQHSLKFEHIIDACDLLRYNPDPDKAKRLQDKRKKGNG